MNSLGRKVLVASLGMLVILACLGTLLVIELDRWHQATRYVMRDYRRSLLDGELQEALTRAMAEKASYALTGHEHFQIESREAIERAEKVIRESREMLEEKPQSPGDAVHAQFLGRQEKLVKATEVALDEAEKNMKLPGEGANVIVPLQGVYATEVEADDLRRETMEHHRAERAENEEELQMHGQRAFVLVMLTAIACTAWTLLLIAYVRQRIVAPITSLAGLTDKVAEGDLGQRSPITHNDEIGRLQRSFNQMVVEVAQKHRELETSRERLARARDAAEAANEAKSSFLANVSHELRTPMNGVIVTLDLMHETAPNEEQRELAELARGSARGLLGMLNDLLDLSRIEAGKLELESVPFEPRQLVSQMVELHGRRAAAKGLEMSCHLADDVPERLTGDPLRLGQVLLNLLDNAIKFTGKGSIRVTVTREPTPIAAVASDDEPQPVGLRFSVQDTGIGVPPEAAPRLFQPFYQVEGTASRRYGGIGLGLGIAQQLARMMGGELQFESEPGKGSVFWFTAFLRPEAATQAPAAAASGPRQFRPGTSVLLVEDNDDNRDVMARVLERRGLRVAVAANGREALERVADDRFDIIMMDCQMPEMDGFTATRAIRQMGGPYARVPIVALTAYGVTGTQRYFDAGFDDLVAKPYTIQEIDEALYRWLVLARDDSAEAGPAPASNSSSSNSSSVTPA